eukprot:CAMPEP_0182599340 /NCGR_PEP_ID=MMETSP1324-20130603/90159_1 /TAXON_ID=236786 /ORGANISM="Florenciella sp., Strain RCC1587" /LENGTH=89 /DNA_ID=CAMNT_0024817233 /DNA_START=650 /DNA_END=919 /DNA_ORIENTATION=+
MYTRGPNSCGSLIDGSAVQVMAIVHTTCMNKLITVSNCSTQTWTLQSSWIIRAISVSVNSATSQLAPTVDEAQSTTASDVTLAAKKPPM